MVTSFTSYFDAGGGEDHGFIVVNGWLSTLSKWDSFEVDWRLLLASYNLPYFHMKHFSQSTGPFSNWKGNETKRRIFLSNVAEIIKSHVQWGAACAVPLDVFEKVNRTYALDRAVGPPYSLAGRDCIAHMHEYLRAKNDGALPPIKYVFEDGDKGKGELIRVMQKDGYSSPIFEPSVDQTTRKGEFRKGVVQLQAADFAAYELRKAIKDDPNDEWPMHRYRKSLQALANIPAWWGKYSELDLITMCGKGALRARVKALKNSS
jgi:hypothetical protein